MLGFLLKRVLSVIPVMFVVAALVFAVLRLTPGDPAAIIAGDGATDAQIDAIRVSMGLDKPVPQQFAIWMGHLAHGNLGTSLISGQSAVSLISDRLGPSVALSLSTILLTIILAIPIGILAAWNQGRFIDRLIMAGSVIGFSVPVFIIGYALILVFSMRLNWFPVQGYATLSAGLWEFAKRLILPTIALSTVYVALIARMTRTSIIEVMNEDFIRTARSKGMREVSVLLFHALRNAAVPIVTVIGVSISMLIGGVVVTESVFNIPGLGRLVVDAVLARDYPVIQALILLFAGLYVLINLLIDLSYTLIDPRIRY